MVDYESFSLGDFPLENGRVLPEAKLAYKTYGQLNSTKTNAVLLCSYFTGNHASYEFLIQPGRCFDPGKYFVISANLFSNGFSSSPSNTPKPLNGPYFPAVSIRDNVRAQHRLVFERWEIKKLAMVAGYSMDAQQAFQWAVTHPEMVERIAPWCGHAHTTPHTFVFLEGVAAALRTDTAWNGGHYDQPPELGLRAAARVAAGWPLSQAWYRQELYKQLGYLTLVDFLARFWESFVMQHDANNLLGQIHTWQTHNVGDSPGFSGDYKKALASITAKAVVMPCQTDLYFPPEDSEEESRYIPNAELKVIPSIWGHFAGIGLNTADTEFIDNAIKACLA
jgi:homoserine O-acetyltransferase